MYGCSREARCRRCEIAGGDIAGGDVRALDRREGTGAATSRLMLARPTRIPFAPAVHTSGLGR
jgi:hypothetical protein